MIIPGSLAHHYTTTTTTRAPTVTKKEESKADISKNQWDQILHKLNFALEKLTTLENNMDPDILDNPQYINSNGDLLSSPGKNNSTDVVVNLVEYEDEEEDDGINLEDYFQAIVDTDNLSLGKESPKV